MQDGGADPTTMGLEPDTPFTPKGEMTAQVQRGIADKLYGQQPQQTAALTLPPDMQGEKQQPATPFDPMSGAQLPGAQSPPSGMGSPGSPTLPSPYPGTQLPGAVGQQPTGFKTPFEMTNPLRPGAGQPSNRPTQPAPSPFEQTAPTPPSTPITSDKDREQQGIRDVQTLAKPTPPPASPTPPGTAPQAPGGTPPSPPSVPPSAAGAAKAQQLVKQPVSALLKQFPALQPFSNMIPDQNLPLGDWIKAHPDLAAKFTPYLSQAGITQQDLQKALQPQTQAQPSQQTQGRNADAQAIIDSAGRLKMDPRMWAAILHYESRFNPTNVNTSGKGYPVRGLIGFDPENVQRYGEPKKTIAEQMPQVEKYMLDRGWKPGVFKPDDLPRAYSIINAGSLDARGEPRWAARDINGDLPKHLANITRDSYGPGDKFLYGKAGETPETPTRTAAAPEAVSRETPAEGTPGRYGPPPGAQMPSPARKFLYQLAYGAEGATLALREKAMELGLYQQLANWDTLRDAQYGSMTPAAAGEHALKEGLATGKLLGAAGGAPEEAGEPGTISHAAATGKSPAGARVSPAGDVPSGGSAAGAPAGASSTPAGAPPLPPATEVALQKGLKLLASGNPGGVALGNSILNGMAQRGMVDAQTIDARIKAAKEAGPVIIPGMGPGRYDPTTGSVEPLTPGAPRLPGVLPPPAPGTTGAGVGPTAPAPGPMGAPAFGAAPGAPTPPAAGRPTPLPTGAEPRPPPGASPAAAAIHQDPAFQPIAQAPRSSSEMFNDPTANSYARDERAWTPNGQAMIKEEAQQAVKDARGHLDADRQADVMLSEIEENLEKLPKTGVLAPGPTMQIRNHIIGTYNDLARITAPALGKDALPQVAPATVGSVEQINKLANTLAFALARTLGSREAVQIVQQARNSVPSADVSPAGARYILQNLRAGIAMDRDYFNGLQNWSSSNLMYGNSIKGFDDWFTATHPSTMYAMRASALAARDDNDKPIDREALDLLKANPDKYQKFEEHFHTPGLGRYYLERQMGAP